MATMTTEHAHPSYPGTDRPVLVGDTVYSAVSGLTGGKVVQITHNEVKIGNTAGVEYVAIRDLRNGPRPDRAITKKVTLTEFQWKLLRDLVGANFLVAQIDALDNAEVVQ